MSDHVRKIEEWYESHCDGDWEHAAGIEIGTLDNPGWRVVIDLEGTALEGVEFKEVTDLAPERDWIRCWVAEKKFHGAGGPRQLDAILGVFLEWAGQNDGRAG